MHQGIAFRVALVAAGDRGDAEEAAQDAFVKAYRALGRFREGSPFRPWLLRIVANEARNRRRSAGRRAGLALRAAAVVSGDAAPSPETTALTLERRDALLGGLAALDERDREVLVHRFLLELGEGRRPVRQRMASANRGSSRTDAKSSSCGAWSRKRGYCSMDRRRCSKTSSLVSPESTEKHARL